MNTTKKARRSDALYFDNISRRELCNLIANLEDERGQLRDLVGDALVTVNNAQRGFATHPKDYRDLRSRAVKLGVSDKDKGKESQK